MPRYPYNIAYPYQDFWLKRVNNIPPLDLTRQYETIGAEVGAAVLAILSSGRYIGGSPVEGFEQQFASYIGVSDCVACNSGTDALYLALRALGIGAGDEVITPAFTFIATGEAISAVGATPVFVDIEPGTYNLDVEKVEALITDRTRAIIPVHLFGQAANMTRLMAIAQAHNLLVIEDCAQATGAEWGGQKVGAIGHVGCFSFFPTKNLGACGDGGAVTTNDPSIASTIRMLREHGSRTRYFHEAIGVNSRLDAVQAAILQIKLRHLDEWNAARRVVAERYAQLLSPITGVVVPQEAAGGRSVWNQYTIRLPGIQPSTPTWAAAGAVEGQPLFLTSATSQHRDAVRNQLQSQGVSSMVYYPLPLHLQPVYQSLNYQLGSLPVSEQFAQEVLSLPMFPELTAEEQERVVYALKDSLVQTSPVES